MTEKQQMTHWLQNIHKNGMTVKQTQEKIRCLHALCELQTELIGNLIEELEDKRANKLRSSKR